MPFYEYECSACGAQVEVLQKITDAPLRKCTECGKNKLTKLVSAPVFRLKGGGWYETDFKTDKDNKRNLVDSDRDAGGKDDKPAEKAGSSAAEKPAGDAASKPEAKPEAKPASARSDAGGSSPKAKPVRRSASRATAGRPAARKPAAKPARAKAKR